jgi:hypothetical protein
MLEMKPDATKSNNAKVFNDMGDVFQTGSPADYISKFNRTLSPWLSSEQAYYPEARPHLVVLFKVSSTWTLKKVFSMINITCRSPTIA